MHACVLPTPVCALSTAVCCHHVLTPANGVDGGGGALYLDFSGAVTSAAVTLTGLTMSWNTNLGKAGAVLLFATELTNTTIAVQDCWFLSNRAGVCL